MDLSDLFDGQRAPGEVLRLLLDANGWSQEEFAAITGRSRQTIIQIMGGRAGITAEMAVVFAAAFGNDPNDWLRLEANYRLSRVKPQTDAIRRRARVHAKIPIREIQRRGWIKSDADVDALESEVKRFLRIASIDDAPQLSVAPRRSGSEPELTPIQVAWCARIRELAEMVPVTAHFDPTHLPRLTHELRELAAYPKEIRHLPRVLAKYGIRFVVIEPLASGKLDGATLWLDPKSPVIATSVRHDRIDNFWHTVFHEMVHVSRGDALVVDATVEAGTPRLPLDMAEDQANRGAAEILVPQNELESFVRRSSPLYSRQLIVQFAHRVKMHPGIIVGQLQHRDEVGFGAFRDFLVKVREVVTATALTDGWGHTMPSLA